MLLSTLSFLVGVSLVQWLTVLPSDTALFGFFMLALACLLVWVFSISKLYPLFSRIGHYQVLTFQICGFVISGFFWAVFCAQSSLNHRLPEDMAGQDVYVNGIVTDIPDSRDKVQRFMFNVQEFKPANSAVTSWRDIPEKIRLSWYYGNRVKSGERWQFLVRLKPPHGFLNPGGFDYEAWLFRQGVHATGYVRSDSENRKLSEAAIYSLDKLRHQLYTHIQTVLAGKAHVGVVAALAVGDRSSISKNQWDTLIKTGTNHLVAISGLHIGLAATFGYWIVRRLLPVGLMKRAPAQQFAVSGGLVVAGVYALLAGLSIPTQRALIMLVFFSGAWLLKRNFRPLLALTSALLAILIWDPASVLSAGFWFSFLAVAVIYYVFSGRLEPGKLWKRWGWMQISIALSLFPASLFLFQQTSLVSPLANLIFVPYVSFLVVPLILISLLLLPFSIVISEYLLIAANNLLELIWPLLNSLSSYKFSHWTATAPGLLEVVLATLGVALVLAPRGFPAKWLAILLISPAIISSTEKLPHGAFELNLLDVGQGLATVIRTHKHVLVFDTGARFSSKLNAGEAVVVPFLRSLSVRAIDAMVISHGDADHIGGALSVLDAYPDTEIIGQGIEHLPSPRRRRCVYGEVWVWDGVEFEFLHPDRVDKRHSAYKRRNNYSCVLRVSGKGGVLLMTGDIESFVEDRLINRDSAKLAADVLVVPHHGSKTSSTQRFVEAVRPRLALISAGYRNRYRLPNKEVMLRYIKSKAELHSTGDSGAITVLFDPLMEVPVIDKYRQNNRRYWNHIVPEPWPEL